MFCIISFVVLSILGIFSATNRALARESLDCVLRRVTLRPCNTGFDEKMKARILGSVSESAKTAGVPCETVHVMNFPADAIIDTAKAKGCDLIVMASHGRRGIARALLGSQAVNVLTHSTLPVLICR